MKKLLTISIAAYNVSNYIRNTLDSLVMNNSVPEKLLDQLEILVVNDGSKDDTIQIANEYEKNYPGIVRVINKENGGHGSTINRGIREATGTYFKALDGDDWFDETALQYLLKELDGRVADLVVTDYYKCFDGGKKILVKVEGCEEVEAGVVQSYEAAIQKIRWIPYHAAIYRTQLLQEHNIKLDEKIFYVDTEYMLYPVQYLETILYLNCGLYCYRLGREGQSVSKESRIKNITHGQKVAKSLLEMYKGIEKNISEGKRKYLIRGIGGHCIWHFRSLLLLPVENVNMKKIIMFDQQVAHVSLDIFKFMDENSKLVHWLRRFDYKIYWIVCFYRQHKKDK